MSVALNRDCVFLTQLGCPINPPPHFIGIATLTRDRRKIPRCIRTIKAIGKQ